MGDFGPAGFQLSGPPARSRLASHSEIRPFGLSCVDERSLRARTAPGGYRLHSKTIPHKWRPGQSGNPAGSSAARRTAARGLTSEATKQVPKPRSNPSPGG
jgi:hypothetical protein